jgi:molybdate transport system ATP-binding protein
VIRARFRVPLASFDLDVALELEKPITALFGPSGAGKTTLIETLAGLRRPVEGEIRIGDEAVFSSSAGISMPPERRRFGYVPQDALLFPHMRVGRNVRYGMRRERGSPSPLSPLSVESVVEALEIGHLLDRSPEVLSGGERQRVALARALVSRPRLLLLDEPVASLDVGLKARILPYLRRVRDLFGIPALVVSHDLSDVMSLSDDVIVLEQGRVVERGEPGAVLKRPAAGAAFFRERFENLFEASVVEHDPEEGWTRVETDRGLFLFVPFRPAANGERVALGILAEDILLAKGAPVGLSARNVIPGNVTTVDEREGVAMVLVDAREPIYVRLTRRAVTELGLERGVPVELIIKTHSVHRLS